VVYRLSHLSAGAPVDVRILGSTEVRHDGSPVVLRGAKPRQLLVLLAMRANRPIPSDQLIEELWDGDPPPSASTALRVHFGRLRHVLEPDRSPSAASVRLPAAPHGYLLRLEPDELDADRFERRVMVARQANSDGEPESAVPHLTEALDLWRGPAFADARDLGAVRSEVARLDELHGAAFEELANARLALGEHALLVDVLLEAIEKFPLREKLTAGLMLALYRSDRAPEALRVFAELARRLDEQLGVVPSQSLRKLEEDILLQRPAMQLMETGSLAQAAVRVRAPTTRMIGRHKELRALATNLQETPDRRRRVSLITGAAGIGKTTLLKELAARMEPEGCRFFFGACVVDPSEPFEIVSQLLHQFDPRLAPAASFTTGSASTEASLNQGGISRVPEESDGVRARFRVFEALTAGFLDHCGPGVIVVFEDLHWADRSTLLFLRHLVRHPGLADVAFIATYRDDEIGGERLELIESLAPPSLCDTHRLGPLSDGEVRSLVRAIAAPESVHILTEHADALRGTTEGNPFFLRELLRDLDEESVKFRSKEDLFALLATMAPSGVRALLNRRVDKLTPIGKGVLQAAAIVSDDISIGLLRDTCELSADASRDAVEECLATRLLVEDLHDLDRFLFPHAMVRNAVEASISTEQRIELHGRIARALLRDRDRSGQVTRIARHFCQSAPHGLEEDAANYIRLAATEAERHLMFADAAALYEQAITWGSTHAETDPSLGSLYLALGRAYANDKQPDRARDALVSAADIARRTSDWALMIDIALSADGPFSSVSELRGLSLTLLQESLPRLDASESTRRVRAFDCMASALYYVDHDQEGRAAHQAVELANRSRDPSAIGTAQLAFRRWLTHSSTARRERLAISRSACAQLASSGQSEDLLLRHQRSLLADLLENGEIDEFHHTLSDYESNAQRLSSPAAIYWAMALRATESTLHGDLAAAEQLARGAALRGYELEQFSDGAFILQRFLIRYEQGRLAEEAIGLRRAASAESVFRAGAALMSTIFSEAGRHERACVVAWETLGPDASKLPRDVYWLAAVALFSGVAAQAGDKDLQALLSELLAGCDSDHVVVFGAGAAVLGSVHHWQGLLAEAAGDLDAAVGHMYDAGSLAERIEAPFWAAQAQMDSSRILLTRGRQGDHEASARLSDLALTTAHRHGFERILRQASQDG
jgi:DNA-binding SARP family transcriptional activator